MAGARTQLLADDELFAVFPAHGRYAAGGEPGAHVRLADLAGVPWIFDPAETGHAAPVIPGLLLAAVPRPAARIMPLPGRPHRRLTTGVRVFREALRQAAREATTPHPH